MVDPPNFCQQTYCLRHEAVGYNVNVPDLIRTDILGTASGFSGSLAGDVTGPQAATVVAFVGTSTAANVHNAELLANAATSLNTPSTIVKRDGAGQLAGTLSTASQPFITGVGTLTSAVWNATPISTAFGGTGQVSYTIGDLLTASGLTTLSKLSSVSAGSYLLSTGVASPTVWSTLKLPNASTTGDLLVSTSANTIGSLPDVATTNVLLSGGIGILPAWGKVDLTTAVTGVLPVTGGGNGLASYTVGDILFASGATVLSRLNDVATGNVLISGGVGAAPSYNKVGLTTHVSGVLPVASGGTNLSSYTIGDLIVATASTTLSSLVDVAAGSYLRSGGVGVSPLWSTVTLPNATAIGDLLLSTSANTVTSLADVATGNALISGGVGSSPAYGKIGLTTHVSGVLPVASGGTNLSSYTVGDLIIATASTTLSSLVDVAAGSYLRSGGVGLSPIWSTVTLPNATAVGDLLLSTSANTVTVLSDVATGNVLLSGGVGVVPAYGKVNLTTAVSNVLPISFGGTGSSVQTSMTMDTPADPSVTASLVGVMMGLAGSNTPNVSGRLRVTICGDMKNDTASDGAQVQVRYGTGVAPANGAALTGTAVGSVIKLVNPDTVVTPGRSPFTAQAVITGLTVGVAVWLDLSLAAITGGNANIYDVCIVATEH